MSLALLFHLRQLLSNQLIFGFGRKLNKKCFCLFSDHLHNITADQVEDAVRSEAKDHLRQGNPLSFLWVQAGMAMGHPITNGISSKLYKDGGFFVPNSKFFVSYFS